MSFTSAFNKVEFKTSDETNNSLNELFNVNSLCRQKPLNERQLPKSFFVQPGGSKISTAFVHHKGFSSPATLEDTYRARPGKEIAYHSKQRSLDSQNYSEINNLSTIELSKPYSPLIDSKPCLKVEVEKLPQGYEMAIDQSNRVYFLNHTTKGTTWFDPRLPEEIQSWGMTLDDLQDLHIDYISQLSMGHLSAKKQSSIASIRMMQQQFSHGDQGQTFSDPKSQKLCSRLLTSPGANVSSSTLNNYQVHEGQPMTHLQYFVNTKSNGNGAAMTNYHELCHLYQNCSSVKGSLSHSSNSSCSNLSTCLNGLNLSPAPITSTHNSGNPLMIPHCQYGCQINQGSTNTPHNHSQQDSFDSGVGQSVASQSYLSTNATSQHNDSNKSFDLSIKLEDSDNIENCFNNNIDELMDIDIQILDF